MSDEESREHALDEVKGHIPWLVQLGISHAWSWFRSLDHEGRVKLIADVIRYLLTLGYLDGYTLYFAGAASIFSGFALICLAVAGDARGSIEEGIAAIILGIGVIGGAKKSDKLIQSQRVLAQVIDAQSAGERATAIEQLPPKPKLLPRGSLRVVLGGKQ